MRSFIWLIAMMVAAVALAAVSSEYNPVRTHPHAAQQTGAIIVKLRAESAGTAARAQARPGPERIAALTGRVRLTLQGERPITDLMHVIQVQAAEPIEQTLARLRADAEVEYAEPDQRRYAHAVPDDPLYATQQWYLQPPDPSSTLAAIDAQDAWTTTTGNNSLVIADIDTGVRYDHPDLLVESSGGRLLPGYCFISDQFVNNGGTCLGTSVSEAEGSDPGDWVTSADLNQPECKHGAMTGPSSWHGTRTAALLGAITNNALGMAGVTWEAQILPVRALGKCGGSDSDIASAMLWAAGIAVSGAPPNPTPAKVINMSLGGSGACPAYYQDVVNQLTAAGVLVVVSAGNEGGPVDAPANCPGVAGVAGLRQAGTKVDYSSLGPEVAVGAPAGNCVHTTITPSTPCLYPITSATNAGTTTPVAYTNPPGSGAFTDQVVNPSLGTSFSAPLVSGIGALMAAVNPNLNSCQLIARLKEGSVPFPQTSVGESTQPPFCHVPSGSSDVQYVECICTQDSQTCGKGMANAPGALKAAARPAASVTASPSQYSAGQTITLQGKASAAASGRALTTYTWSSVSGETVSIASPSSPSVAITVPSCGLSVARLTVMDSVGASDTADVVITPSGATALPPAAPVSACTSSVQLGVCPAAANVTVGGGGQSFTADVAGTTDTAVTWQVNGVTGGNTTVGTISTTGVYTAPATVPPSASVTITAISSADSAVTATSQVTIVTAKSGGGGTLDVGTLLLGTLLLAWSRLRRVQLRS